MAAMARAEGEPAGMADSEIDAHLTACPACRNDLAMVIAAGKQLSRVRRAAIPGDLWPEVERRIAPRPTAWAYVILGVLMVAFKLFDLAPGVTSGLALELVPALIAISALWWVRENPFRIVTELPLEGEKQ
jgi:predicted anti-sigma-YlaC factor YlaD